MKRRPFLLLSLFIAGAGLLQAAVGAKSTPPSIDGKLPEGMVCTACGPIYSANAPRLVLLDTTKP